MAQYIGRLGLLLLVTTLFALPGCDSNNPVEEQFGAVFAMTNAAAGNEVVVFRRAADGGLTRVGAVATGGNGSGPPSMAPPFDPLGSQEALILSADNAFLFVVNAGSNSISSFRVEDDGNVSLIGTVASGGGFPVSLTLNNDLLYVLNAGGAGNISGFRVAADGMLTALANSTRPLSGTDTPLPNDMVAPATVAFSPDGSHLVVTEKATSLIDVYTVGSDGLPSAPSVQMSAAPTPFGAEFDRNGFFIVSEANAPMGPTMPVPDGSSVSSYALAADGTLSTVTGVARTEETAACWVEITEDGRYVYTTNTASGTITGFSIGADGTLTSLDPSDGVTADLGAMSVLLEMAVAGEYLYVLAAGNGEVNGFRIETDGSLTAVPGATVGGLPGSSTEGLAAF